ncbi:hypothetical protein T4D_16837 [Trichinella pseudospiralis]|uniref:Uncharacterized protein n=1 Tax=Trichinella pseudospiralis TaxID=6337 RepID=A0A0V1FTL2_TRIPS|nr:hypothetical protein T4D_16837 [Trichinella pseudospiralis]
MIVYETNNCIRKRRERKRSIISCLKLATTLHIKEYVKIGEIGFTKGKIVLSSSNANRNERKENLHTGLILVFGINIRNDGLQQKAYEDGKI